jgi:hypothetical protein
MNNYLAEMWSGFEEGSHLRFIECCITQFQAQEQQRREEEYLEAGTGVVAQGLLETTDTHRH